MDDSMEKFSASPAFLSSPSTTGDNSECTGAENSLLNTRTMTITDGRFFKIVPEKCVSNTTVATCVKCEPRVIEIKGTINSSSNFLCHLKRKHGSDAVQEYTTYLQTKKRVKRQVYDTPTRQLRSKATAAQETLERNVLKFVIDSMIPLKAVTSPSFLALFKHLNTSESDLKLINFQNLSSKIEQFFQKTSEQLRIECRAASHIFCTANIWCGENRRFLVTTAHWINEDMKRRSAALRFQRLNSKCSSEKLNEMLSKIQCEFGLRGTKFNTIVGEYSCEFFKTMSAYGVELHSIDYPNDSPYEDDLDLNDHECISLNNDILLPLSPDHFKCYVQTLTTCASVDIAKFISDSKHLSKLHERVMKICNFLWNHPESEDILEDITGLTLTPPKSNSWTSIYNSLEEILSVKHKSLEIFQAFEIKDCLQESEFLYIEEHLACTKPLVDALMILQGNEHTLFGSLLPTLLALRHHLNKLLEREWVYCRPLVVDNVKNINEKFKDIYNFSTKESLDASVAAFSHPEFKNRWLSCVEGKFQTMILQAFKDAVAAELPATRSTDTGKTYVPSIYDFFDFGTENEVIEPISSKAVAEMQVLNFFNNTNRSMSSLHHFPEIKKIFLKYNTPLSSFAPVESMFNYNTLIEALMSDKLVHKNIEMRVLLKANMSMVKALE